jgi:hypothetical protein
MLALSRGLSDTALFAALMPLFASTCACSDLGNCPSAKPDITIESGVTYQDAKTYQSAPPWGPRDPFPAKTKVHFVHQLGFVPEIRQSFVSFYPENSNASENAGNQGEWLCIDDEEFVLRNGTCEDFYIVVSAQGSGAQHAPCRCSERQDDGTCPS